MEHRSCPAGNRLPLRLTKRGCGTILAGVLALGVLVPAVAPASAKPKPYTVYVACGLSANAQPAHSCAKGSKKAAFFRSNLADVNYKVCVRFPTGLRLCANHQPSPKGTLHTNQIHSRYPGIHKVTWFVKGKQVGVRYLRVRH